MKNYYLIGLSLINIFMVLTPNNAQVITTTQENQQVVAALTEAASPSIPLFSTTPQEKSKLQIYQGIMPLLPTVNVTPETAQKAVENFIVDVVDNALNTITVISSQLSDAKAAVKSAKDALVYHSNNLRAQTGTKAAALQRNIGDLLATLLAKQRALSSKIKAQEDFLNLLTQAKKIPQTQLASKVSSYQSILNQITSNIVDGSRQEFMDDLSRLVTQAKKTPQENSVKQLLDSATRLLPERKDFLDSLKLALTQQDQPALTTTLTTPAMPALTITPTTPILASPTLAASTPTLATQAPTPVAPAPTLAAPTTLKAATPIPQIPPTPLPRQIAPAPSTAALAQLDLPPMPPVATVVKAPKRGIKGALPRQPSERKKPARPVTKAAVKLALKSPTQKQPQKVALATPEKELPAIQFALESTTDFMQIVDACAKTLSLLTTKIKPEEKITLKQLLAQRIPQLYNERANRTEQEIVALNKLFQATAKNKESVALVSKNQLETTNALAQITIAINQRKTPQKITLFSLAVQTLAPSIDRYEKQLFIDGVTTIFKTRKDFSKAELEQVQKMFADLSSKPARKRKILDASTYQQLENWGRIVQCTLILTAPTPQKTFKDLVRLYQSTLPYISLPEATYEREFFISNTLSALFAHRGNVKLSDIRALHTFFDKTVKTPNLLAANQVPVVMFWIQELTNAELLATHDKTYLQALIDRAVTTKNIASYSAALMLFTQHTHADVRRAFIIALNTLFSQRNTPPTVNKQQLSNLLEEVGRKKLTPATPFLSPNQKTKLTEWQTTLATEIKAGA